MQNPVSSKPKLNSGATSLVIECPKSLKAFSHQLNQGDKLMAAPMNAIAIMGPNNPKNA
jgi:hypothetical protein